MTKLKSKKMSKSTFAIIIMAIAMVAMLAFGGTYAYFTAQATTIERSNVTTAKVQISTTAPDNFAVAKKVVSGSYVIGALNTPATIAVTNASDVETFIIVKAAALVTIGEDKKEVVVGDATDGEALVDLTITGWTELSAGVYYKKVAASAQPGELSVTAKINEDLVANRTQNGDSYTATSNAYIKGGANIEDIMEKTVSITLEFKAIQTEGLTGADEKGMAGSAYSILFPAA